MNIAVNTRLLIGDLHSGIGWFTYETLRRITSQHKKHNFFFLFDRPYSNKFIFSENITPIILKPRASHPILWHYWMEINVSAILKDISADIFLSPDGMIPLRTEVPCLPVIHDINFVHRTKDLPFFQSLYYRKQYKRFAENAVRIATVSEYSKKDISSSWNIDPAKIDVIYNGVSEIYRNSVSRNEDSHSRNPYFIFVGNLSPRKNIPNMIRAFDNFRDKSSISHQLLIAGNRYYMNGEIDRLISQSDYKKDIILLGKKNQEELKLLYTNAVALLFVPWFEGFGIPVVEAMSCGTPVITSNVTSLPEVSGDAALFVDPSSIADITAAMVNIAGNTNLRKKMSADGILQSSKFNWDTSAESLWTSMMKSIKSQ